MERLKFMTKSHTENHGATQNTGNASTVHSPKAPGEVEKVNPTTGGTTTEQTGHKPAKS